MDNVRLENPDEIEYSFHVFITFSNLEDAPIQIDSQVQAENNCSLNCNSDQKR